MYWRQKKKQDGEGNHDDFYNGLITSENENWGSFLKIDSDTAEPQSFESGHVFIETKGIERINETIDLVVNSEIIPIRVWEVEYPYKLEHSEDLSAGLSVEEDESIHVQWDLGVEAVVSATTLNPSPISNNKTINSKETVVPNSTEMNYDQTRKRGRSIAKGDGDIIVEHSGFGSKIEEKSCAESVTTISMGDGVKLEDIASSVCPDFEWNPSRFLTGVWLNDWWRCGIVCVYAPCSIEESERQGCCGSVTGMENFGNFLNDASLVDIPMQDDEDWGPRPFRFLYCWMDKQKHVHDIELEWARGVSYPFFTAGFFRFGGSYGAFLYNFDRSKSVA
ncbi:hypothetical protein V6N13_113832 [Hibiscus sabdariffa]